MTLVLHLCSFNCNRRTKNHYMMMMMMISGDRRPSSVRLSDVAYIGSNSKTKRPRKTKLCTGVPQVTCDSHTDFKVKRSKVKVTGGGILWRPHSRTACFFVKCNISTSSRKREKMQNQNYPFVHTVFLPPTVMVVN